jgi:hypothetical protein
MLHEYIIEETPFMIRVHDPTRDFAFDLGGWAPVQAWGEIAGREFYFRARHTAWSCEVSDTQGNLPSDGQAAADGFIREGEYGNASYMPWPEALKIIERCMNEYAARETG